MSRTIQHVVPTGLITGILFHMADRSTDAVFDVLDSKSVSTLTIIVYLIFAFCVSAGFSLGFLLLAKAVESFEQKRQGLAKVLPCTLPLLIGAVFGGLFYVVVSRFYSGDVDFFSFISMALPFCLIFMFGVYWTILLLERVIISGFRRFSHEVSV
jgi:hypothetical protein